jgi:hypothetical protein
MSSFNDELRLEVEKNKIIVFSSSVLKPFAYPDGMKRTLGDEEDKTNFSTTCVSIFAAPIRADPDAT